MRKNRYWGIFVFAVFMFWGLKTHDALASGVETKIQESAPEKRYEVYTAVFDSSATREDIQRVLDYRKSGKAKKIVITLKGSIQIGGSLYVYSDTTINAHGATITETKKKGSLLASATAARFGSYGRETGYRMTRNITINGGTWNGAQNAGQVIHFVHSSNVTLQGLAVSGCTATGHLISLEGVDTAKVSGCTLTGYAGMANAKEALHLDIVHSRVTTPGLLDEEYDDLPDKNITICNNIIKDVPNGIGSHGAVNGVYHQNIVISDNKITNVKNVAVKLYNYKNTAVRRNTIQNAASGIKVYTYYEDKNAKDKTEGYYNPNRYTKLEPLPVGHDYKIEIAGNIIRNTRSGSAIFLQGSKTRPMYGVSITGNVIRTSGWLGIRLNAYCKDAVISKNEVTGCKLNGIDLRNHSDGCLISYNKVNRSGENGINVSQDITDVKVKNNKVKKSNGNGIRVSEAKRVLVSKNQISAVKRNGIYGKIVSSLDVSSNTIQKAKGQKVLLEEAKKTKIKNIKKTKVSKAAKQQTKNKSKNQGKKKKKDA